MRKKNKLISLAERWKNDRIVKRGSKKGALIAVPQCELCENAVKGDALHCKKYADTTKPKCVLFASRECDQFHHYDPLEVTVENREDEMLLGGYFGFIVGDALGVPVEFKPRFERAKDPVREMRAYGTYYQPFGTWSDDTALTLCLAVSIAYDFSLESIVKNIIDFYTEGYMTPYGEVFDIGNTTKLAIEKMIQGVTPVDCGGTSVRDNGNGSLMRVLPLAYSTQDMAPDERIKLVGDISALTHAHPRSKLACIFYVQMGIALLQGAGKEEAYQSAIDFVKEFCAEQYADELPHFQRILDGALSSVEEDDIRSTGYVVDTLEAAVWAFLTTDNYRDTVLKAVNLGCDTDTVAAIAGGLAGIHYGYSAIPKNWVDILAHKKVIYYILLELKNNGEYPTAS